MNSKFLLTPTKIKEAREKQGLTRAHIAKELGFAPGNTTSDTDPNIRINQQITGMPERIIIGLVIRTNEPVKLESAIHRLLKHFDRHISDAPGTEWFLTSPDEIRELYNLLIEEYK